MDQNQESVQLLQDIRAGSRQAFDHFYELHIQFVFQIAFQLVREQAEAEDVCHDVFLEVLQKTTQYQPAKGSVKAWLAVKTRSRALDRLRKKKPLLTDEWEQKMGKEESGADLKVLKQIEKDVLFDALKQIPSEQREAIYRSYYQEETHKEIAMTMQKPLGSVKSLIRYGLNNLRKQKSIFHWAKSSGGGNHHE